MVGYKPVNAIKSTVIVQRQLGQQLRTYALASKIMSKSKKRSNEIDSEEELENATKIAKTTDGNFWLYLKADSGNICKIAMKNKAFEKALAEITKNCPLEMEKNKFFISKEILRISCRNDVQQKSLLNLKVIDGHSVTVTLPWALTRTNDEVFNETKQTKPKA